MGATFFFRLIDKRTGRVVDCQTEPLRANRPGGKISLDLAGTAYDLPAGDTLELQVSTSTDTYSPNRGAVVVTLANGTVSVPTLTGPPAPATQGLLAPVPQGSASEAGATRAEASQGQTRRHRAAPVDRPAAAHAWL
jgi:hypothetical protein